MHVRIHFPFSRRHPANVRSWLAFCAAVPLLITLAVGTAAAVPSAAPAGEDAARRLYRKYRMELFRFGVHVLHDQGLAEEMVQETFIKFCQQAGRNDPGRGPVRGWLFTMAKSAAVDIARRPSSRPLLPVEDFQLPPQYDTVDQALTVLTVDQALDKLPSIYGDVMRLVRDGFTHSEIAERLNIPIGTVKSRMAKASDTLKAELASLRSGGDDAF